MEFEYFSNSSKLVVIRHLGGEAGNLRANRLPAGRQPVQAELSDFEPRRGVSEHKDLPAAECDQRVPGTAEQGELDPEVLHALLASVRRHRHLEAAAERVRHLQGVGGDLD